MNTNLRYIKISFLHIPMICFLLFLGIFWLYYQVIFFDFVEYDEATVLLAHPNLYNETDFFASLKAIFIDYFPREEPLLFRDITWAIDSYFFGFRNPLGYHLGNVLLNSLNSVLIFLFLYGLRKQVFLSLIIAITFGVHPIHVEPVCWIMGRKDMLVAFFMLLTLLIQHRMFNTNDPIQKNTWYLLSILTLILALLSKINALTFCIVMFLHHVFYPYLSTQMSDNQELSISWALKKIFPVYIPHILISLCIYYWYNTILTTWGLMDRGIDSSSLSHLKTVLIFTPIIIGLYIKLLFYPFGYSVHYRWPSYDFPIEFHDIWVSGFIVCVLMLLGIFFYKNKKSFFFFYLCFFVIMVPYFNIVYIGIWMTNRYLYFSSLCILTCCVWWVSEQVKHQWITFVIGISCSMISIALVLMTINYQKSWQHNQSLCAYEVTIDRPSLSSHASLAASYLKFAKKESSPIQKNELLRQADELIQQGFTLLNDLKIRPDSAYHTNLLYLQGILSRYKNEPIDTQLGYLMKAYQFRPFELSVLGRIAWIYYEQALSIKTSSEVEYLASQSLNFYQQCLFHLPKDMVLRYNCLQRLNHGYAKDFPFLKHRVDALIEKLGTGDY
ncbi:MAG: hypothetical protein HQK77_15935 [Desulfobacterales bacterium]|nr:hypothetical protein [Desulfobacterales bacterium]